MESARFAQALGETRCTMCRLAAPEFTRAVAYAEYADEMRELLHLLKYQGVRRMAEQELGAWLAAAILQLESGSPPPTFTNLTVVAVPLFGARERTRGFNQSVLLADAAIAKLKRLRPSWRLIARHGALSRVRDTEAQYGLQPRARRQNVRGAFRVTDDTCIKSSEVLLIDDIMTTGATARECARLLRRAGATRVWVATLARAQTEAASTGVAMWEVKPPAAQVTFV